jgi:hypothetical protein
VVAEMVTSLEDHESVARGMFVVGSGVDVAAVKAHLTDVVSMPVIAPEEPQLALARGAALASANAPRYDASTVGLAYSQDPDGTTAQTMAALLGHDDASPDAADIASDSDDVPERSKPFLLVGSLTAIFVAGVMALVIAMVGNVQPRVDQHSGAMTVHPGAAAPPPALQSAPPTAPQQVPKTVPAPAPAAPPPAPVATARLKVLPAPPPPRVLVRNAAPAPAAPPPAPAAPPPVVVPPAIPPPPIMQWPVPWLPPILRPPPYYNPRLQSPPWYPGPRGPRSGHGDSDWERPGSRHGHDDGD